MDPTLITLLIAVASGLLGIFFGHRLAGDRDIRMRQAILDREAEIRRREFMRLVVRGCCRIQRPATPDHAPEDPWIAYNISITEISAEFAMCDGDFSDSTKIVDALSEAATLQKEQVETKVRESGGDHRKILTGYLAAISDAIHSK
jgi:hypothetical protein